MGACDSKEAIDGVDQATRDMDNQLRMERLRALHHFKVLVLGAGESGKSTVIKQIRLSQRGEPLRLSTSDRRNLRETLVQNLNDSVMSVINAADRFGIVFEEEFQLIIERIRNSEMSNGRLDEALAHELVNLVHSGSFQLILHEHKGQFWILDSADYYFEHAVRFSIDPFEGTEQDFVMARIRTTGIVQSHFDLPNPSATDELDSMLHWELIDVGGQRNERRKWIHCFDDVHAIMFVVNLAGYNRPLFEDETIVRLREALNLFSDIVQKRLFQRTPIYLLLNKKDLFEESLREEDLSVCFEDYSDGNGVRSSLDYIGEQFRSRMPPNSPPLRVFEIAARVRREVKYAFADISASVYSMNQARIQQEAKRLREELRYAEKSPSKTRSEKQAKADDSTPADAATQAGTSAVEAAGSSGDI